MEKTYQFLGSEPPSKTADLTRGETLQLLSETYGAKNGFERIDLLELGHVLSVKGGIIRKKF